MTEEQKQERLVSLQYEYNRAFDPSSILGLEHSRRIQLIMAESSPHSEHFLSIADGLQRALDEMKAERGQALLSIERAMAFIKQTPASELTDENIQAARTLE